MASRFARIDARVSSDAWLCISSFEAASKRPFPRRASERARSAPPDVAACTSLEGREEARQLHDPALLEQRTPEPALLAPYVLLGLRPAVVDAGPRDDDLGLDLRQPFDEPRAHLGRVLPG
jgi:hypothetical protein